MTRVAALLLAMGMSAAVLAGCSSNSSGDSGAVVDAAVPAVAAEPTPVPAGTVQPVGAVLTGAQQVPGSTLLALLTDTPYRVLLLDTANPGSAPRSIALPARATSLAPGRDGHVLVAADGAVLDVDAAAGTLAATRVDGDVTSVTALPDGSVAAGLADGAVIEVRTDGSLGQRVTGLASADDLVVAGGSVYAVDRRQTSLYTVDVGDGSLGAGLRAGTGAANAVADRFGRVVLTDTASGQLLVFGTTPFLERQQFPVPGAPWALVYDPVRDLVWVTLTGTDQVVGYQLTGGEPVERYRFPTVHRPVAVAVDSTGVVFVASAAGDGVQRLDPGSAR